MRHGFSSDDELIAVEGVPEIGKKYHVNWAFSRGVVGVCMSVDEKNRTVVLRTPKTKKDFKRPVKWSDLRHLRKEQLRIMAKRGISSTG